MRVVWLGRAEWWTLWQDSEEDDADGKDVDLYTLVFFTEVNLRSHVWKCTKLCLHQARIIPAHKRCWEAEIGNFKYIISVKEEILGFQVTMCKSFLVHVIKSIDKLVEVVSCLWLGKSTTQGNEVKEFAPSDQLEYNVLD